MAVFSSSNREVDYASIGVNIVRLKPGSGYPEMSGNSMAAPHMVGLIRKSQVQGKNYVLHLEETHGSLTLVSKGWIWPQELDS